MALPTPIPDNPLRWDGWRNYHSDDYYARLCLAYESNPSAEQIEQNCRQLLIWWQKKLPLKNQPSNPLSQLLRAGMDEAPGFLAEARTKLLDAEERAQFDQTMHARAMEAALGEFRKLLSFALGENKLRQEDEARLYERGRALGLTRVAMAEAIDGELVKAGAERVATTVPIAPTLGAGNAGTPAAAGGDASAEFQRMLRLSKLALDGEEMTDDQRDALCNMGESLGLTGGQAEDLIDEYLDEASGIPAPAAGPQKLAPSAPISAPKTPAAKVSAKAPIIISPLARTEERQKFTNFTNSAGMEMLLVPSGTFLMGSTALQATPAEQPVGKVTLSCFYLARFPVTNAQFEQCDPRHAAKRATWGNSDHPVIYVSSREAEKFCEWLSAREGRKYRLPTEAEWEYAARGEDHREYPWGEIFDDGQRANFADARTTFPWRDANIDDGFATTAPVGSFPRGASPFGIEDLAGNVFEWCLDYFENYRGKDRVNPRNGNSSGKRIYRGGSWKSRAATLRSAARNFNLPDYSSNDVGFRILCECEK